MTERPGIDLSEVLAQAREQYIAGRPEGARLHAEATRVMPGGNTRTVLYHPPFPLRVASGHKQRIVDVDGHEYVDFLGEYTAGLYGHSPEPILDAVREVLAEGISLGAHNRYEAQLARLLVDRFPAMELVRFTNSGTEANLMAISLARVVTGRSAIGVMRGAYHGGVLYFGGEGSSPVNVPFETVVMEFNDIEGARAAIRDNADRLAAVIVEPVLGSGGVILGDEEFLSVLRDETAANDVLLILDEVMTSRLSPQGAGELFGVTPDLMTVGKYLGGGMSFGAFGGRADLMARFDPSQPDALPHAGTFNNNVLSMAAGIAGLTKILDDERLRDLNRRGALLRAELEGVMVPHGWAVTGRGSMVGIHPVPGPVNTYGDIADADDRLRELLYLDLLERGYYMAPRGFIALSLEITDADIAGFVAAVDDALASRR
ncbi:MAG: aminotransferase class III-fold pyridoxal phosphate-dependent enzyme [Candidatus Nanopelagicales bacterium]|jgi:glutamate-1-semialdehyde 2,1-aminomutase